jgi:hypothetical protein
MSLSKILSNSNLKVGYYQKISHTHRTISNNQKMPQIKVTKRKDENKKMAKIIEILQTVPEQKESKLSENGKKESKTAGPKISVETDMVKEIRALS